MPSSIDSALRRKARFPHELLMINLAGFHLLLAPAAIALDIGAWGLLLPPLLSGLVIAYIAIRGARAASSEPYLVFAHWKLAWRRCLMLLMGYAGSVVLIGGGALLALTTADPNMKSIVFTIATRIGVMPTVIVVLIGLVLSNSALDLANKGEVPDSIKRRYPEPRQEHGEI
jgi:hypothetical protein